MKGVVPIVGRADLLPDVDGQLAVQPDADDEVGEAALAPSVEQPPSAAQGGDAAHNEGGQAQGDAEQNEGDSERREPEDTQESFPAPPADAASASLDGE